MKTREQTHDSRRQECHGMQVNQAKEMEKMGKENQHLRRAVAELTVDNLIRECTNLFCIPVCVSAEVQDVCRRTETQGNGPRSFHRQ